jgi:membrane fusion protein (multidrug efflux system)
MTAQAIDPNPAGAGRPVSGKPARRASTTKRMIIMLIIVGVVLFLIFGFGAFRNVMIGKFLATLKNPPQTVATMIAQTSAFQSQQTATGSLVALEGANLSSEVSGIVDTISFKSGQDVKKGQLLVTLRANNDDALLAQLQTAATLDRVTYQRDTAQFHAQAVSRQTVDTDRANLAGAEAQVKSQQALMAEKKIYAPFSGRIGIRQVDLGQYLAAGTTIASLQSLNPIDIDFYLPQAALRTIHPGMKVAVTVDAFGTTPFDGTIDALDSSVSTASRMIQVRASLSNPHEELRPGMFGRAAIDVGAPQTLVTLPQTAIAYNPYGDTVFIAVPIKHDATPTGKVTVPQKPGAKAAPPQPTLEAKQVFVTLGQTRGDQVAVLKGVAKGDQVVVAGQVKLKNGSPIMVNNKVLPQNSPNPSVPND